MQFEFSNFTEKFPTLFISSLIPSFFDHLMVTYLFKFCPFIILEPFFGTFDEMFAKNLKSSLYSQKFGKSSASRSIPKVVCCSITEFYLESLVLLSLASFFRKFLSRFFSLFMICHLYTQIERIRSLHPTVAVSNSSSQTPNHCRNI